MLAGRGTRSRRQPWQQQQTRKAKLSAAIDLAGIVVLKARADMLFSCWFYNVKTLLRSTLREHKRSKVTRLVPSRLWNRSELVITREEFGETGPPQNKETDGM